MLLRCAVAFVIWTVVVTAQAAALVRVGDPWRYLPGVQEPGLPGEDWRSPAFRDDSWLVGRSGFSLGYGTAGEATVLPALTPPYTTVYLRRTFQLTDLASVKWLTLRIDYSDGFVAFLNGREIARQNVEGPPGSPVAWNRLASAYRARGGAIELDVTAGTNALAAGVNTLAIQGLSSSPSGLGLNVSAELVANFNRAPYLQNVSSNQVQVIWKTPVPADTRLVYTSEAGPLAVMADPAVVTTHVVTLTNLSPGTRYNYQASSAAEGEVASEPPATFRTFAPSGPVTFVAFGDGGWNSLPQYDVAEVIRQANPDLAIETGDNVYPSFTSALVDLRCFSVYQPQMANTPFYFALGNHDLYSGVSSYLDAFYLPTNSVSLAEHALFGTSPEHYYSFDAGDAHFVVLYVPFISQYKLRVGDPQYRWLSNDLAQTRQPWKIAIWHVPMNSSSAHRFDDYDLNGTYDRLDIRDVLLPVLSEHGVQLVLCGHEHGYDRFNPTNGVHAITTAGAGSVLYGFTELDEASAYYAERYHCVKVRVDGDVLRADALGVGGEVFDSVTIRRRPPPPTVYDASWHTPHLEAGPANDGAGNVAGQVFDLVGEPIPSLTGQFSNLGYAYVNNDQTNLYVGLAGTELYRGNNVFLFIEFPRAPGVTNLLGLGNGVVDPDQQGVDGLDLLENLAFTGFQPGIACVLGDEYADGQFRSFTRTNLALNIGQGVFHLDASLTDVPGARVQQFHLSPQAPGVRYWPNAAYMEVAIPLAELGGAGPGDVVKVGAVVAGAEFDVATQARAMDTGFIGGSFSGVGLGPVVLEGVQVRLAADPDPDEDHDGMTHSQELAAGTDPSLADTDGDGLPDGWEVSHRLNPLVPTGPDGPDGDPDADGVSNRQEFLMGTDPVDARSALRIEARSQPGNKLQLSFGAAPHRKYYLQARNDSRSPFLDLDGIVIPVKDAATNLTIMVDLAPLREPATFYRLRVEPAP